MVLALKYRPQRLEQIIGQEHLLSPKAPIYRLIQANALPHMFVYGPPGCGKTTLARVIATQLDKQFYEFNATSFKVEELRKILKQYSGSLSKPLIFIDEVHRLSKNQQEVLLPFMENSAAIFVGASTENPYFSMTAAIRSRSHLFELKAIDTKTMQDYISHIIDQEDIAIDPNALIYLATSSSGDVRAALNLLESASHISEKISIDTLKSIRPHALQSGSIQDDTHYDLTSAMIKSIRGSDIDAGIYYLARLISGGEPPEYIARRLAILASEDIGNANPNALNLAASTLTIVKQIGYPEARIPLAQLVVYLASSPKSNSSYLAINNAIRDITSGEIHPIPDHIKTRAEKYLSPHDHGGWIAQPYLYHKKNYYQSKGMGFEKKLNEWIGLIKEEGD